MKPFAIIRWKVDATTKDRANAIAKANGLGFEIIPINPMLWHVLSPE